jgi:hypothetical protein
MRRIASAVIGIAITATLPSVGLGAGSASAEPAPAVVALLLDTSGSIHPPDLARAQTLAGALLKALPQGSQVAVFTFDDQSRLVLPRTSDLSAVTRAVESAKISGQWTALNDALYDASRYLRDTPPVRRAIVLITDGQDENSALNLDDALAVAEATNIPVFAVGVGRVQERVLRRIAKLTSGEYVSGSSARGEALAKAISELPPPGSKAAESTPPSSLARAASSGKPKEEAASAGPPPARGRSIASLAGAGLLVLVLLALLALRRKPKARCPTCGRDLPGPLSSCAFCAEDAPTPLGHDQTLPPTTLPETVMERLSGTEEFLEKTVTLRENPVLVITKGAGVGQSFPVRLESVTSLGRAKLNDVVLADVAVSSQHSRIRPEEGRFVLHDLRSTNGTFVNERRVSRYALNEGDTIKIGETLLQFRTDQKRT